MLYQLSYLGPMVNQPSAARRRVAEYHGPREAIKERALPKHIPMRVPARLTTRPAAAWRGARLDEKRWLTTGGTRGRGNRRIGGPPCGGPLEHPVGKLERPAGALECRAGSLECRETAQ